MSGAIPHVRGGECWFSCSVLVRALIRSRRIGGWCWLAAGQQITHRMILLFGRDDTHVPKPLGVMEIRGRFEHLLTITGDQVVFASYARVRH
jgi:hypothetical protein